MDQAGRAGVGGRSSGGILSGANAAQGTVELAVQLDRARATYDIGRLIDTNDIAYRIFLRAKLQRHIELADRDADR